MNGPKPLPMQSARYMMQNTEPRVSGAFTFISVALRLGPATLLMTPASPTATARSAHTHSQ